jgi:hypothetical protein
MSGCRPEHLARFVVEIVEQWDLRALESAYRGSGKAAYHPGMLTALLIYGYATGTYSSRAIEKASHDSVAFRYIAANQSPDHDTRTCARRRSKRNCGTKCEISWHAPKRLTAPRCRRVYRSPTNWRGARLGFRPLPKLRPRLKRGRQNASPTSNVTTKSGSRPAKPERRPAASVQEAVRRSRRLAAHLSVSPSDVRQVALMLEQLAKIPEDLGQPTTVLADAGYFSQANVERCLARDVRPLIAKRRDQHYRPWLDCLAEPPTIDTAAGPVERMAHDMQSRDGRDLYRLRKQTVEPVFGIIKFVMRFRQFLLRGLSKATGE